MASLELSHVGKTFDEVAIVRDVSLRIEDGEFIVFVGPSGCGKSTLLRLIAGLESVNTGTIAIGNRVVNDIKPSERSIAMVFQSYALYPHMTVRQNMSIGLQVSGVAKDEIRRRVDAAMQILQLDALMNRKPAQLSGGQRQRVAIGRAIVRSPEVFLFDEPLSNLDAELRVQMRQEIFSLHEKLGTTMIYVTHDQVEAMTLADRIVVLKDGRVEQIGAPLELYARPANVFVAGFIGSPKMNFLEAALVSQEGSLARLCAEPIGDVTIELGAGRVLKPGRYTIGVRPEAIRIGVAGDVSFSGEVAAKEVLGNLGYLYLDTTAATRLIVEVPSTANIGRHERHRFSFDVDRCHLFDEQGVAVPLGHSGVCQPDAGEIRASTRRAQIS
jgi:ABC-type sugar transport system ATPase subunit